MPREEFQNLVLECQKLINQNSFIKRFCNLEKTTFIDILDNSDIYVESVVFLRAVRTQTTNLLGEHPDLHRETF